MFSNDISRQRPQNRSCVGPESVEGSRDSRALSRECTGLLLPGQSPPRSWGGLPGQPLAYSSGKCKYYWFSSQQTLNRFQWSNLDKVAYHLNDGKRESVSHSDVPHSLQPLWSVARQAPLSMGFSRPEYRSGQPFPSQEIFPTQGSDPGLTHCRRIPYQLSHKGSPKCLSTLKAFHRIRSVLEEGGFRWCCCCYWPGSQFLSNKIGLLKSI